MTIKTLELDPIRLYVVSQCKTRWSKIDPSPDPNAKPGLVYLVQCPMDTYASVGQWSGSLDQLMTRYSRYYGCPQITAVWCFDAKTMMRNLQARFRAEKLQMLNANLVVSNDIWAGDKMLGMFHDVLKTSPDENADE